VIRPRRKDEQNEKVWNPLASGTRGGGIIGRGGESFKRKERRREGIAAQSDLGRRGPRCKNKKTSGVKTAR